MDPYNSDELSKQQFVAQPEFHYQQQQNPMNTQNHQPQWIQQTDPQQYYYYPIDYNQYPEYFVPNTYYQQPHQLVDPNQQQQHHQLYYMPQNHYAQNIQMFRNGEVAPSSHYFDQFENLKRTYEPTVYTTNYARPEKEIKLSRSSGNSVVQTRQSNERIRVNGHYRTPYDDLIKKTLEAEFEISDYISVEKKAELSQRLNLSQRQIKIWFQNRRAKSRRQIQKTMQSRETLA